MGILSAQRPSNRRSTLRPWWCSLCRRRRSVQRNLAMATDPSPSNPKLCRDSACHSSCLPGTPLPSSQHRPLPAVPPSPLSRTSRFRSWGRDRAPWETPRLWLWLGAAAARMEPRSSAARPACSPWWLPSLPERAGSLVVEWGLRRFSRPRKLPPWLRCLRSIRRSIKTLDRVRMDRWLPAPPPPSPPPCPLLLPLRLAPPSPCRQKIRGAHQPR